MYPCKNTLRHANDFSIFHHTNVLATHPVVIFDMNLKGCWRNVRTDLLSCISEQVDKRSAACSSWSIHTARRTSQLGENGCKQQHTCDRHIRVMGDERSCPGSIAHVAETLCVWAETPCVWAETLCVWAETLCVWAETPC